MKKIEKMNDLIGFTLAEVLITLGIIGVVSAITIPILMTQMQDKQLKEAAKEAYAKASQAIQLMKQDEGGSLSYYSNSSSTFKPIFMKYFKVAQDCNWNDCVLGADSSNIYTTLSGFPARTWFMFNGQFITTDGMFWGFVNDSTKLIITVDVNGYLKKPNIYGRDVFAFQLLNDNLIPMGRSDTYLPSGTYCSRSNTDTAVGLGCMINVMQGTNY